MVNASLLDQQFLFSFYNDRFTSLWYNALTQVFIRQYQLHIVTLTYLMRLLISTRTRLLYDGNAILLLKPKGSNCNNLLSFDLQSRLCRSRQVIAD